MHVVSFLKSDYSAPSGGRINFSKNTDLTLQTFIYVDEGFSITVRQNSIRLATTIIQKVLLMHVVRFLKSDHSAPSGGTLNFSKNTDLTLQTFIYVDGGFSKTIQQNSMKLCTTIIQKPLLIQVVSFLTSDHSAPSGG